MTSNHVKTSLMGNYKINDVKVDIYFSPEVIEAYASNDEINLINSLKTGEEYDRDPLEKHFDNIFEINEPFKFNPPAEIFHPFIFVFWTF